MLLALAVPALAEGGPVMVSLGDSYSSGEGIEPFYGQEAEMALRCQDPDWLAHRSEKSWPGMLTLPGLEGPMREHKDTNWFFAASSGAKSFHLWQITPEEAATGQSAEQQKKYSREGISGAAVLPPQLAIFDVLDEKGLKADYVTLSIGGNDIGFVKIVSAAAGGSLSRLEGDTPEEKAEALVNTIRTDPAIRGDIRRAYTDVARRAGSQARILVAGYPLLLAPEGGDGIFPAESARILNLACGLLNDFLREIVEECRAGGISIWFVSVEEAFAGHGAYSPDPYINPLLSSTGTQDLNSPGWLSMYSIHPNEKGAEAYARCVQAAIDALEAETPARP